MTEYHKIQSVYKRDLETKFKTFLKGQYSLPEFEYLASNQWIWTEKVDGTNIRVIVQDGKVTFGGRTDKAHIPALLVDRLREIFDDITPSLNEMFPDGACLYGEGYGGNIQKAGPQYRTNPDFTLFDIKVGPWWLERDALEEISKKIDIRLVPVIGSGTLHELTEFVSNGFTSQWGMFQAEGVVARPAVELRARDGSRIITKLKCRDFKT